MIGNRSLDYAWLQISDLHIFSDKNEHLIRKAFADLPYADNVKFIILTGNLRQRKGTYKEAEIFLQTISSLYNLNKKDIYIVPGNHDCGHCQNKAAYNTYIENHIDTDKNCYQKYFVKGKLADCFDEYSEFIKKFYGASVYSKYPFPEQISAATWSNRLNIIHLNTAINCNENENLRQITDIRQLSNLYEILNENLPSIVIAHHAFDDIHQTHQESLIRFFSDWKVSAYLCGNLYRKQYFTIKLLSGTEIPCIVCGNSAFADNAKFNLGCILYIKYTDSNEVDVHPYIWNSIHNKFQEISIFSNNKHIFRFELQNTEYNVHKQAGTRKSKKKNTFLEKGESIWLPDAENAKGKQTRFGTFTETKFIKQYISLESFCWGLSAVKGIGKTFVLQIKKTKMPNEKLCLPLGVKPSADNGWGTDAVIFDAKTDFSYLTDFSNVVILWKYCIIVYSINQLVNISNNVSETWWTADNPEKKLFSEIDKLNLEGQISKETYIFCIDENYTNLNGIMKGVLAKRDWIAFISSDLPYLLLLKRKINNTLKLINKKNIVILIDKVDQSLMQTNAEPPVNCDVCKKKNVSKQCTQKSDDYCNDESTPCRYKCCYGCEKFVSIYSDTGLRVYSKSSSKFKHINIWQYIQIGLLSAVFQIKMEFEGIIEVYFTIRSEAFSCEIGLLGQNAKKILNIVDELWYTKEEQREIFYKCIENQSEDYLFNPNFLRYRNKIEEAFVGVDRLCHPYAENLDESVFDSIYRHSFDRTRDIQEYGEMLTNHMDEIRACQSFLERGEKVKELIEEKAAKLAFYDAAIVNNDCYYVEKMNLLPNFWADMDNFKHIITMFVKNLMFGSEVQTLCEKFNKIKCEKSCKECKANHHPFSMLFKLGMLGQIKINYSRQSDVYQEFLHSKNVTYITGEELININEDTIYILHPALTKSIEHLNQKVKHFKGFILGKGLKVSQKDLQKLIADYENLSQLEYDSIYFSGK